MSALPPDDADDGGEWFPGAAGAQAGRSSVSEDGRVLQRNQAPGTSGGTGSTPTIQGTGYDKQVPFAHLVQFFQAVVSASSRSAKVELVRRLLSEYHDVNWYPLLRLLLPHEDRERQTYGMKETGLAKLYISIFGLANTSDGRRLREWKRPTALAGQVMVSGDFAAVVRDVLKDRAAPVSEPTLSLADVNALLDRIARAPDQSARAPIMAELLRRQSSADHYWVVKVIQKELAIGLSTPTVLNCFHQDAVQHFQHYSDLRKVCVDLANPDTRMDSRIRFGAPFKPMLCKRLEQFPAIPSLMHFEPFYVETKYDGVRIVAHVARDPGTKEIRAKYWTRKATDYTSFISSSFNQHWDTVLGPDVLDIVLDGEAVGWDTTLGVYADFSSLRPIAGRDTARMLDPTTEETDETRGKVLLFVVFDIVYLNGQPLAYLPLRDRLQRLRRVVHPGNATTTATSVPPIQLARQTTCQTVGEVERLLEDCIQQRQEGLVIKAPSSQYRPSSGSSRSDAWLKVKSEYFSSLTEELDLVVVGGYFGKGRRNVQNLAPSTFMLALVDDSAGAVSADGGSGDAEPVFLSFVKVGSGYSDRQLRELNALLAPHWKTYRRSSPPAVLRLASGFKEQPDLYCDPRQAGIVLQVKAGQINATDKFAAGYTLRFPRVTAIRDDKAWDEAWTLQQMREYVKQHGTGNINNISLITTGDGAGAGDGPGRKRRRVDAAGTSSSSSLAGGGAPAVPRHFRDTLPRAVVPVGEVFAGKSFCVLATSSELKLKEELERLIKEHGGAYVQTPQAGVTDAVISGGRTRRVRNLELQGVFDVLRPCWLRECVAAQHVIPLEHRHVWSSTRETMEQFDLQVDRYGDSLYHATSADELRQVFRDMKPLPPPISHDALADLERLLWPNTAPYSPFRLVVAYIDIYAVIGDPGTLLTDTELSLASLLLRLYGGRVAVTPTDPSVTHVVYDHRDMSRYHAIEAALREDRRASGTTALRAMPICVAHPWIKACVESQEVVHESMFPVL